MTSRGARLADLAGSLYMSVAVDLREQILTGALRPGQQLPGETGLGNQYGVSRPTVRSALALLRKEGLVDTRRGLGTFVRHQRVRQTLAHLESLDETIAEQGLTATSKVLDYRFLAASLSMRTALQLAPGSDVLFVRRIHLIEGDRIALVEVTLPGELGADFSRRDTEQHTLFELVRTRSGLEIGSAVQSMRAESAEVETAEALRIPVGAPVLVCERVTSATSGDPIVHALFTYRADRFEFRASLSSHEWRVPWAAPGLASLASPQAKEENRIG